ncbi:hypothetical protein V6N11_045562 [Hibiscus sabdariffa]|uniref:MBD domain-containing protein n=1 Tax=Hibiscus sabdariffa TaxID=183260 RepID=A0ABR2Q1Q7_9ROSI
MGKQKPETGGKIKIQRKTRRDGRHVVNKDSDWLPKREKRVGFVALENIKLEFFMGVAKATTSAIEAVPISFIPASSQDNVPIHPNLNQDNALPSQDNAQRTRKRRSRSTLPDEFLENWVVSEKQRPNGRFDKYYTHKQLKFVCRSMKEVSRYNTDGIRPRRPKKTKFNQEQAQDSQSLLALPWDNKADPSISTVPSTSVVPEGVAEATSCAIEAVPISFILASTQDNVPIYPDLNQDKAPPSQDNAQRTRRRRSRSSLPDEFLENLVVSEKQRPNGRVDKALPWEGKADPSISTVPSTSIVPEEEMKSSNNESDFDLNDLVAFIQLIDVPKTIIDRFENE